jgi:hypothetical protein
MVMARQLLKRLIARRSAATPFWRGISAVQPIITKTLPLISYAILRAGKFFVIMGAASTHGQTQGVGDSTVLFINGIRSPACRTLIMVTRAISRRPGS